MRTHTFCVVFILAATLAGCARGQGPRAARAAQELQQRFALADRNADGRLDREEARAGMPWVHANFDVIDVQRTGAVSMEQVRQHALANARQRKAGAGGF